MRGHLVRRWIMMQYCIHLRTLIHSPTLNQGKTREQSLRRNSGFTTKYRKGNSKALGAHSTHAKSTDFNLKFRTPSTLGLGKGREASGMESRDQQLASDCPSSNCRQGAISRFVHLFFVTFLFFDSALGSTNQLSTRNSSVFHIRPLGYKSGLGSKDLIVRYPSKI